MNAKTLPKKYLFIDRDGTLIYEPEITKQVNGLQELVFLPWVILSLSKFKKAWYELIIVTNQDGLWTTKNPLENYNVINKKMFEIFASEWVEFSYIFECPHFPEENCSCRKPKLWILRDFLETHDIDTWNSFMIWDRETDREFAQNLWIWFEKVLFWDSNFNWNTITDKILPNT